MNAGQRGRGGHLYIHLQMEFFLNVSLNSVNSATKIFVITVKGLKPITSYERDQDATTATARHIREREYL